LFRQTMPLRRNDIIVGLFLTAYFSSVHDMISLLLLSFCRRVRYHPGRISIVVPHRCPVLPGTAAGKDV